MAKKRERKSALKDFLKKPHFKGFYYMFFAFFLLIFLVSVVFSDGASLKAVLFSDTSDTFMDHYNSVVYNGVDDPYTIRVVYPPLASYLYKLCNIAVPSDDYESLVTDPSVLAQSRYLRISQSFVFQFVVYAIIALLLFLAALCFLKKGSTGEKALFVAATVLSTPFLYMADRGNNVLLPVAFSIIFIVLYNSENKILREIALISLAISVGLKIYPLAFIVFFIADKRYKDLLRELVYVFITLILPFFIFYNGFTSMMLMVKNLFGFSSKRTTEYNVSGLLDFKRIFFYLYGTLQKYTGVAISDEMRELYANICRYGISAVCGLGILFSKKMWKRAALVAAIIFGFPGSASTYLFVFMVIPIALFLDEEKTPSVRNYLYLTCFALTMVPLILTYDGSYSRYYPTKIASFAVLGIVVLALIDMISDFAAWNEERRRAGEPFFRTAGEALLYKFFKNRKSPAASAALASSADAPQESSGSAEDVSLEAEPVPAVSSARRFGNIDFSENGGDEQ
ncbi:MAG: DUF2029 domain-containing protein [Clostridia bacterium]|nr:DUF2029 domain-containing protein [Clostridia bacterium]